MSDLATCCGVSLSICLLIGIILFAVSFGTVSPLEVGILYNDVTKRIEEDGPYFSGRYFVGLGSSFITYPGTWQLLEYPPGSLRAWTKEGQLITLTVSVYWEFDRKNIVDFFYKFGEDEVEYLQVFEDVATRALKKVTTEYEAIEFFSARAEIGRKMKISVREAFLQHNIIVQLVNLESIDLPNTFEAQVVTKVVTKQQVKTQDWLKKIDVSRAEIDVIDGEGDADVQLKLASADANADLVKENAASLGARRVREAEVTYYDQVKTSLSLTGDEMIKLRYAKSPQDLETAYADRTIKFAFGYGNPVVTVN